MTEFTTTFLAKFNTFLHLTIPLIFNSFPSNDEVWHNVIQLQNNKPLVFVGSIFFAYSLCSSAYNIKLIRELAQTRKKYEFAKKLYYKERRITNQSKKLKT